MSKKHKIKPQDIKIVHDEQRLWETQIALSEQEIKNAKNVIRFNEAVLEMAQKKLEEFKSRQSSTNNITSS